MKITPLDIRQQQFKRKIRGFAVEEVNSFMEIVAEEFEKLVKQNITLEEKLQRKKREVEELKDNEATLRDTIVAARSMGEKLKENAQKEADLIIKEAELKADEIIDKVHLRAAKIQDDIIELKRQRKQFEIKIKSAIETHQKMLEIGEEGDEEKEDRLRFLRTK